MPPSRIGLGRDAGPIVVAKPRDRFRFDWASTDDTVADANNQPVCSAAALRRGFLADIDRAKEGRGGASEGLRRARRRRRLDMRVGELDGQAPR
ncbi:hypothetical protein ZWY2020_040149 [Hordeum vulgare]|nr:hypothetical protein ZWY2020_040149 [Hordeum vulgare]